MEAITNIFRDAFFFTYSTFSFLKYENADISVTQKMGHVLNTQNSLTRPGLFPICVYLSAPERSSVPFFLSLCSNHTRPISDSCTHDLIILWNVRLFFLQCGLPGWLTLWRIYLQCRRPGFNPWVGKIPWEGKGNPLQSSCLENPMGRGPGGLQPTGSQGVGHDWVTNTFTPQYRQQNLLRITDKLSSPC